MKKLMLGFLATMWVGALAVPFSPLSPVIAQDPLNEVCTGTAGAESTTCAGRSVNNPVNYVVANVIRIVLAVTGVAAVVVIIIAGFRYIIASGDPSSIEGAKNAILFAVIGLVVAVTGQVIVAFVIQRL